MNLKSMPVLGNIFFPFRTYCFIVIALLALTFAGCARVHVQGVATRIMLDPNDLEKLYEKITKRENVRFPRDSGILQERDRYYSIRLASLDQSSGRMSAMIYPGEAGPPDGDEN